VLTYINRIYYPFMVREPELGDADGHLWALWIHACSSSSGPSAIMLGSAIVLPSLEHLPAALAASEESISRSGTPSPSSPSPPPLPQRLRLPTY